MPEAETAHLADEEIKLCWIIQADDEGRLRASLTGILNARTQSAFAYWEMTGKHSLLCSSVTDQLCSVQVKQRNVESCLHQLCYAGQLCKQPALGREEAEERSHLTHFSKNTQVQNSFIFSYLIFSWAKEKEVPSRVKMYSMYMLVFFKKNPTSTETTKHCKQRTLNKRFIGTAETF